MLSKPRATCVSKNKVPPVHHLGIYLVVISNTILSYFMVHRYVNIKER
jgi:hypothetical protein